MRDQVKFAQTTVNNLADLILNLKPLFFNAKLSCSFTLLFKKKTKTKPTNFLYRTKATSPMCFSFIPNCEIMKGENQLVKRRDEDQLLSLGGGWGAWHSSDFLNSTCILPSEEVVLGGKTGSSGDTKHLFKIVML